MFVGISLRDLARDFRVEFERLRHREIRELKHQAPVVQTLDNAIQRINHYPVDKYRQNKPRYPLDSDLSGG